MQDFAELRTKMVDTQLRTNSVTSYRILDAMEAVPREMFLSPALRPIAYADADIPVAESSDEKRFLQKPMVFAKLIQAAEIKPDDFVLVVGCNSGYALAVVAQLAGAVVGVEGDTGLAQRADELMTELGVENADVVQGPLTKGCASQGPYDVILFDGAAETVPDEIVEQLRDGGRLVYVDGEGRSAQAIVLHKSDGTIGRRAVFNASAPMLPGFEREIGFTFE